MNITKNNYKLVAAKVYNNPIMDEIEFSQDLSLITKVINRLSKFSTTGELNSNLLLNNYKIVCNCFGESFVSKVLLLVSKPSDINLIMTWLYFVTGNTSSIVINESLRVEFNIVNLNKTLINRLQKDLTCL